MSHIEYSNSDLRDQQTGPYEQPPIAGLKSILYYLEPSVELDDPLFRYSSYRAILLPEARALLDHEPRLRVTFVLSAALFERAAAEGHVDDRITYAPIPANAFQIDPVAAYKESLTDADVKNVVSILHEHVGTSQPPELVLAYEQAGSIPKAAWPNSLVLNMMFGAFSRAPFPTLASIDPLGTQGKSFLGQYAEEIRNWNISEDEREFIRAARKSLFSLVSSYQPYKREITRLRQRSRKMVLFPCQVDGHYSVRGTSVSFRTHLEAIKVVAGSLPPETMLLVTQHNYRPALTPDQIAELRAEFQNVEVFENSLGIPDVTQFLLPYADGLATFSSSLGFQAALWGIPLLTLSDCYLNSISDTNDPSHFASLINDESLDLHRFDAALAFILLRYCRPYKTDVFKGPAFYDGLKELAAALRVDPTGRTYFFERQVDVSDASARFLSSTTEHVLKRQLGQTPLQTDHLISAICRHEVISFDLFDTLVERPFIEPPDSFLALEREVQALPGLRRLPFAKLRRQAEADVRRPTQGAFEITIDDIYDRLGELAGVDPEVQTRLQEMELEMELQICSRKATIEPHLRVARLTSRAIVIASDFYIGEDFVSKLLQEKSISYSKLFVSATERSRKHNGTMFKLIIDYAASLGVDRSAILHIGDNLIADVSMAKHAGVHAFWAPSGNVNMRKSAIGKTYLKGALSMRSSASSVLSGMIANRFYNAPFNQIDPTDTYNGELFQVGYSAFGPLITGFAQWIKQWTSTRGVQKILFLSRDGKIVLDAYRELYGDQEQSLHYVLTSRRALKVASLTDTSTLMDLARQAFNAQPLDEYMRNRFGFEIQARHVRILREHRLHPHSVVSVEYNFGRLLGVVQALGAEILSSARAERDAYLTYLQHQGILDDLKSGTVAVVDIGYSGSIQKGLEAIVPEADIHGLYILTHEVAGRDFDTHRIHGFLAGFDDHQTAYRHPLNNHVFLFETGFSSLEGSLVKMEQQADGCVRPVSLAAGGEIERVRLLGQLHAGILEFSKDFKSRLGRYVDHVTLGARVAESQLISFANNPSNKDAALFVGCEVENLFGGGSVHLIEPTLADAKSMTPDLIQHAIKASAWKQGAHVVYGTTPASSAAKNLQPKQPRSLQENPRRELLVSSPELPASNALSPQKRKGRLAKLARDPYRYFNDARNPVSRTLRHAFGDNAVGRMNSVLLSRILNFRKES